MGFGWLVFQLRGVVGAVVFAFLIAYLLDPLLDGCESLRIPRSLGAAILLLVVLGALWAFVLLALPGVVQDVVAFARQLPASAERVLAAVRPWLTSLGAPLPATMKELVESLPIDLGSLSGSVFGPVMHAVGWALGGTASVVQAAAAAVLVPVLAFYLLVDFDRIVAAAHELVPPRHRKLVGVLASDVDNVLGQFVRGQLSVMLLLGVLYAAGFGLVGLRLALPVGLVAGLISFIPYVGGAVALGLALLIVLLNWTGWLQLALVVAVYVVIQLLEGFLITPRIVGDRIGLSPLWVLIALMAGGELFGFTGVLLALPMAAVVKVFLIHGLSHYKQSRFFGAGEG